MMLEHDIILSKRNFMVTKESNINRLSFEYIYMFIMVIYMAQMTPETCRMVGTISGNPVPFLLPMVLTGILLFRNPIKWRNNNLFFVLAVFSVWTIFQLIKLKDFSTQHLSHYFFLYYSLIIAFIHVRVFKRKLFRYYEDIVAIVSAIDIFFWIIAVIVPYSELFFELFPPANHGSNVLYLYHWMIEPKSEFYYVMRNSGFSWEPGRFAIILCIAIMSNLYRKGISFRGNPTIIVLLLALLTTQSTTGYSIVVVLYLFFFFSKVSSQTIIKSLVIGLPIIVGILQMDFMTKKIKSSLQVAVQNEKFEQAETYYATVGGMEEHFSLDRFPSLYFEALNIINDPILGYSRDFSKSKFAKDYISDFSLTGGFAQIFGQYGLICGFAIYSMLFVSSAFVSRRFRNPRKSILGVCLLLCSFSYQVFIVPLFTAFWLYGIYAGRSGWLFDRTPEKKKQITPAKM